MSKERSAGTPAAARHAEAVTVTPSPGRREKRRQRTRDAILGAALSLFGERGVYATRIEDITERADVGKGAFYNYFDSKSALIAELLSRTVAHLDAACRAAGRPRDPLPRRVAALVRAHDRFFEGHPEQRLLFHQARGLLLLDLADAAPIQAVFLDYLRRVDHLLELERAGWPRRRRLDLAAAVGGAVLGFSSLRGAFGLAPDPALLEQLLAHGVSGLARSRPAQP